MGNQTCPCKAAPTPPVRQQLGGSSASRCDPGAGLSTSAITSWGFNALELAGYDLAQVAYDLLQGPSLECQGSSAQVLHGFVNRVQTGYLPNVFHGFHHAVDVLQMVTLLGRLMPWEVLSSSSQRFALAVAALGHDVGHPGRSNAFLVEACDELAFRYNDASPLENMHCSKLFEILRKTDADVFGHLPRGELRELRKLMIDAILHTDVAYHGTLTTALEEVYREHPQAFAGGRDVACKDGMGLTKEQILALSNDAAKALPAHALLHVADLSHTARPWDLAHAWAVRAQEELFLQGDQERALGIPVQPLNDRKMAALPDVQLSFIHAVVAPLISAEVRLFRAWQDLAGSLAANSKEWGAKLVDCKEDVKQADTRVHDTCTMLESAMHGSPGQKFVSGMMAEEPCAEPSVNCIPEAAFPDAPRPPLVREVRRWQEAGKDGQNRELVLLYVVSDDPAGSGQGQPIIFRYCSRDDAKGEHDVRRASFSTPTPALQAADAGCMRLESGGFDSLLSTFLARGAPVQPTASEEVNSMRRSSRQSYQTGLKSWILALGQTLTSSEMPRSSTDLR
mmetsp:Transcript_95561/g.279447  ORF Transcript_95561/g.279447 Transcript_95561/m.279447 type:complete len:566 (-) Transcript_95561:103-1800(-)